MHENGILFIFISETNQVILFDTQVIILDAGFISFTSQTCANWNLCV